MIMRAWLLLALTFAVARSELVGWTTNAWPACEHIGSREISPGLLYKQRWAADVYAAIEERRAAVLRNNWGVGGVTAVPEWWTADGVTNFVVAFERDVLAEAKRLTRYLAPFYLNDELVDPANFEAEYMAWANSRRDWTTNVYTNVTWTWGCPVVEHPGTDQTIIRTIFGDNPPTWSPVIATNSAMRAVTLEGAEDLPSTALTWTPWRLWEGICTPVTSYLGPSLVFRTASVTGLCNAVTINSATATAGAVTASVIENPCFVANGNDEVVVWVTNPGAVTATAVRVTFTVDSRLLLASPYGTNAAQIPAFHAWRGAPVVAEMGDIPPGATRTVIQLNCTLAGYQGESPHAGGEWYATDFGWDTVLHSLNRMKATVSGLGGLNDPEADWYGPEYERWVGSGQSFRGSWAAAKVALEADIEYEAAGTYDTLDIVRPRMTYNGNFGDFGPLPEGDNTNCLWTASFDSSRAPAYFVNPLTYPTNLPVAVDWWTEVITTTEDGVDQEADLLFIETVGFVADGTPNNALTETKVGGEAIASETAPGDPADGPDYNEPELTEDDELVVRDNLTLNVREYSSSPIAVIRFTFTHRDDP